MHEKTLIKLCYLTTILGILTLYILYFSINPPTSSLQSMKNIGIDQTVKIEGKITKIKESDKIYTLQLAHSCTEEVLVFKNGLIDLQEGQEVKFHVKKEEFGDEQVAVVHRILS